MRGCKINHTNLTSALFATFLAFVFFGFAATLVPFGLVTSPAVSRHVNCKYNSVSIPARFPVSRIRHGQKSFRIVRFNFRSIFWFISLSIFWFLFSKAKAFDSASVLLLVNYPFRWRRIFYKCVFTSVCIGYFPAAEVRHFCPLSHKDQICITLKKNLVGVVFLRTYVY